MKKLRVFVVLALCLTLAMTFVACAGNVNMDKAVSLKDGKIIISNKVEVDNIVLTIGGKIYTYQSVNEIDLDALNLPHDSYSVNVSVNYKGDNNNVLSKELNFNYASKAAKTNLATPNISMSDDHKKIVWGAVANAKSYQIWRSANSATVADKFTLRAEVDTNEYEFVNKPDLISPLIENPREFKYYVVAVPNDATLYSNSLNSNTLMFSNISKPNLTLDPTKGEYIYWLPIAKEAEQKALGITVSYKLYTRKTAQSSDIAPLVDEPFTLLASYTQDTPKGTLPDKDSTKVYQYNIKDLKDDVAGYKNEFYLEINLLSADGKIVGYADRSDLIILNIFEKLPAITDAKIANNVISWTYSFVNGSAIEDFEIDVYKVVDIYGKVIKVDTSVAVGIKQRLFVKYVDGTLNYKLDLANYLPSSEGTTKANNLLISDGEDLDIEAGKYWFSVKAKANGKYTEGGVEIVNNKYINSEPTAVSDTNSFIVQSQIGVTDSKIEFITEKDTANNDVVKKYLTFTKQAGVASYDIFKGNAIIENVPVTANDTIIKVDITKYIYADKDVVNTFKVVPQIASTKVDGGADLTLYVVPTSYRLHKELPLPTVGKQLAAMNIQLFWNVSPELFDYVTEYKLYYKNIHKAGNKFQIYTYDKSSIVNSNSYNSLLINDMLKDATAPGCAEGTLFANGTETEFFALSMTTKKDTGVDNLISYIDFTPEIADTNNKLIEVKKFDFDGTIPSINFDNKGDELRVWWEARSLFVGNENDVKKFYFKGFVVDLIKEEVGVGGGVTKTVVYTTPMVKAFDSPGVAFPYTYSTIIPAGAMADFPAGEYKIVVRGIGDKFVKDCTFIKKDTNNIDIEYPVYKLNDIGEIQIDADYNITNTLTPGVSYLVNINRFDANGKKEIICASKPLADFVVGGKINIASIAEMKKAGRYEVSVFAKESDLNTLPKISTKRVKLNVVRYGNPTNPTKTQNSDGTFVFNWKISSEEFSDAPKYIIKTTLKDGSSTTEEILNVNNSLTKTLSAAEVALGSSYSVLAVTGTLFKEDAITKVKTYCMSASDFGNPSKWKQLDTPDVQLIGNAISWRPVSGTNVEYYVSYKKDTDINWVKMDKPIGTNNFDVSKLQGKYTFTVKAVGKEIAPSEEAVLEIVLKNKISAPVASFDNTTKKAIVWKQENISGADTYIDQYKILYTLTRVQYSLDAKGNVVGETLVTDNMIEYVPYSAGVVTADGKLTFTYNFPKITLGEISNIKVQAIAKNPETTYYENSDIVEFNKIGGVVKAVTILKTITLQTPTIAFSATDDYLATWDKIDANTQIMAKNYRIIFCDETGKFIAGDSLQNYPTINTFNFKARFTGASIKMFIQAVGDGKYYISSTETYAQVAPANVITATQKDIVVSDVTINNLGVINWSNKYATKYNVLYNGSIIAEVSREAHTFNAKEWILKEFGKLVPANFGADIPLQIQAIGDGKMFKNTIVDTVKVNVVKPNVTINYEQATRTFKFNKISKQNLLVYLERNYNTEIAYIIEALDITETTASGVTTCSVVVNDALLAKLKAKNDGRFTLAVQGEENFFAKDTKTFVWEVETDIIKNSEMILTKQLVVNTSTIKTADGVISWDNLEGAVEYILDITGGFNNTTTERISIKATDYAGRARYDLKVLGIGDFNVSITAIGDGAVYTSSVKTAVAGTVTVAKKLATPIISSNNNCITWNNISNATGIYMEVSTLTSGVWSAFAPVTGNVASSQLSVAFSQVDIVRKTVDGNLQIFLRANGIEFYQITKNTRFRIQMFDGDLVDSQTNPLLYKPSNFSNELEFNLNKFTNPNVTYNRGAFSWIFNDTNFDSMLITYEFTDGKPVPTTYKNTVSTRGGSILMDKIVDENGKTPDWSLASNGIKFTFLMVSNGNIINNGGKMEIVISTESKPVNMIVKTLDAININNNAGNIVVNKDEISWAKVKNATSYDIYVDNVKKQTILAIADPVDVAPVKLALNDLISKVTANSAKIKIVAVTDNNIDLSNADLSTHDNIYYLPSSNEIAINLSSVSVTVATQPYNDVTNTLDFSLTSALPSGFSIGVSLYKFDETTAKETLTLTNVGANYHVAFNYMTGKNYKLNINLITDEITNSKLKYDGLANAINVIKGETVMVDVTNTEKMSDVKLDSMFIDDEANSVTITNTTVIGTKVIFKADAFASNANNLIIKVTDKNGKISYYNYKIAGAAEYTINIFDIIANCVITSTDTFKISFAQGIANQAFLLDSDFTKEFTYDGYKTQVPEKISGVKVEMKEVGGVFDHYLRWSPYPDVTVTTGTTTVNYFVKGYKVTINNAAAVTINGNGSDVTVYKIPKAHIILEQNLFKVEPIFNTSSPADLVRADKTAFVLQKKVATAPDSAIVNSFNYNNVDNQFEWIDATLDINYSIFINGIKGNAVKKQGATNVFCCKLENQKYDTLSIKLTRRNGVDGIESLPATIATSFTKLATIKNTNIRVNANGEINWDAIANATSYLVKITNAEGTQLASFTSADRTLTKADLTSNGIVDFATLTDTTSFYIQIKAMANGKISSDFNDKFLYQVNVFKDGNVQVDSINGSLKWEAIPNSTKYELSFYKDNSGSYVLVGSVISLAQNITTFDVKTTLTTVGEYYYVLKVFGNNFNFINSAGKVAKGNSIEIKQLATPNALVQTPNSLYFAWNAVAGVESYKIVINQGAKTFNYTLNTNKLYLGDIEGLLDSSTGLAKNTNFSLAITATATDARWLSSSTFTKANCTYSFVGLGTFENPFELSTESDFDIFKNGATTIDDNTKFELANNITLSTNNARTLKGIIQGNGFEITLTNGKLFDTISANAQINNAIIRSNISGYAITAENTGVVIGENNGTLNGVLMFVTINNTTFTSSTGVSSFALIGKNNATGVVDNSMLSLKVKGSDTTNTAITIKIANVACVNNGKITNTNVDNDIQLTTSNKITAVVIAGVVLENNGELVSNNIYGYCYYTDSVANTISLAGIAIDNKGIIKNIASNLYIKNTSNGIATVSGGVINNTALASIINCKFIADMDAIVAHTTATPASLSGVAFDNKGMIDGVSVSGVIYAKCKVAGISMTNSGTIQNSSVASPSLYATNSVYGVVEINEASGKIIKTNASSLIYYFGTLAETAFAAGFVLTNNGNIEGCSVSGNILTTYTNTAMVLASGFAVTNNKAIKNSFVTNKAQVKGAYVVGFVFENNANADIWNSDVSATLVGKEYAVGFVYNNATTIYGSCFEGTIVSEKYAAGFVYDNKTNGVINNSYVKTQAIINEALSFNQISIEARIQVAGFAFINSGIIKNTYAITSLGLINSIAGGDIAKKAGGYVLTNNANAQIYNSYFVGNIQSNGTNLDKDIFANSDVGDIQNCYYNEDVANETSKYPYILAKSNAQMKNLEFYGEYYNQRIWSNVSGDYPKIKENAPISLYTPKLILTGTTISWGHNDLATAYYVLATDKLNNSVKYSIAIKTTTKIGSTTNTYYDSKTKTFAIDLMQIADTNFVLELGHEYDIQVVASSIDAGNYVNPFEADKVSTDKFYSVSLPSVAVAFNQYETPLGAGTLASPYEIQNARQLAWIKGNHSVAGGNHYYKLMKDIDLNNANWAPIGDVSNNFSGSFDGGGFSILNINIATGIDYVIKKGSASIIDKTNKVFDEKVVVSGLFGVIGTNGAVKNVKLNSTATNVNKAQITHNEIDFTYMYQMSGMLAGINLGVIEDVNFVNHASMTYDIAGTKCNSYIGGLVGYNAGTISAQNKDYSVKANFDLKYTQGNATDVYVGGIAGANEGTIKNYSANASVSAQKKNVNEIKLNIYFGGIAGVNKNKGIIETVNSYVQIKSIANLNELYVGGVAGENQAKIVDVITDGIINFNIANDFTSAYIGGVIGRNYIVNDINIKNDVSNANSAVSITVTGSAKAVYAGGIIAEFVLANNSELCNNPLKNSTYKGIIDIFNGEQYNTRVAGGIVGELSLGTKIEGCSTINASIKGYTVGGLVGINDGSISKCQAQGVADGLIVGGAVGYNQAIVTQTSTEATVYAYSTKANIDAGGFVGLADRQNDIKDSYCHNALFVIANSNKEINVGGFVGKLTAGNITNCYADNNITLYKPKIVKVENKLATPYISLDKQNLVASDIPNATGYVVYAQGATDVNYSEVATINTLQGVTFTVENNLGTLQLALNCGVSKYIINATNPTIVVKAIAPKYTDSELSNTITIKNNTGIVSSSYQKPLRPEVMFEGDITAANSKIKVNAVNASGYQIYKKNNTTKVYAPFGNKLVSTLNQIEISIARRVNGVTYFSFNFNASLIAEEFVSDAAGDLFAVTVFDANGKESEKSNILDIKSSSVTTHIKQTETTITTDATGFTWAMPSGATAKLYYKNKEGKFVVSSGLVKGNRINVTNENGTIKLSNTDNSVIEGALKYTSTVAIQIVGKDALEDSGLSNEITLTTFSGANTTQKIEAASLSYDVNNENIVVKTIEGVGKYRIYVKKANKFVPITLGGATDTSIIDGVSNDFIINVKIVINSSKIVFNFYFNGKLIYQTEDKSVVLAVTTVVGAEESSFSNAVTFANEPQGANGFAGNCTNKSDFKSCYFNTVNGNGLDFEKSSAKAITAETMKIKATFAGWDFDKIWDLGGVRPTLRN